jgi:replicative DNA helicase
MNLEGVALKLLLTEQDKNKALSAYSALRPEYLSEAFKSVFKATTDFYDTQGYVPSLNELALYRGRDTKISAAVSSISLIETDGIDIYFAIDELANQYAQNITLELFENVLNKISIMDRHDLMEVVSEIPQKLEDSLQETEGVFTMDNMDIFEAPEDMANRRFASGISNKLDAETGGFYLEDLILLGGKRGSGKSIVAANLCRNQSRDGFVSVFVTIEMTAKETMQRIMSMQTGVPFSRIKLGTITAEDKLRMAEYIASRYEGGSEFLAQVLKEEGTILDFRMFEARLKTSRREIDEGKIVIVDDREPTLASLDTRVASLRARYGDKLKLVVVDYVNQVKLNHSSEDMYDWKDQVSVSKGLKNLARKHGVCVVSPFQMDANGEARFAKGLLDACDAAYLIKVDDKESGHIVFVTSKARSADDGGSYRVSMNWESLQVDPREVILEEDTAGATDEMPTPAKKKKPNSRPKEDAAELELR